MNRDVSMLKEALKGEGLAELVSGQANQPSIPTKFVTVFLKSDHPKGFGSSALRQLDPLEMPIPDIQVPVESQKPNNQTKQKAIKFSDEIKYFRSFEISCKNKSLVLNKRTQRNQNRYFKTTERFEFTAENGSLLTEQRPIRNMDGVLELKRELNRAQIVREAEQNNRTRKLLQSNAEKVLQMRLKKGE